MDLFNRKRVAQLERANANLNRRLEQWERDEAKRQGEITKLVRDVREMDQLIFQMQTAGTPDQLRSAVQRAYAITEPRMREESDRIANLLIPEIKKAYL